MRRPGAAFAALPPMGWNGYNRFSRDVTAGLVEAQARALVDSGMKAAGYTYVNLDGGWNLPQRDTAGRLQPDPGRFPRGIRALADHVHSLGLGFGIYTSFGTQNCAGTSAGGYGHYERDARTFASWGVDYVKVDWCHVPTGEHPGMTVAQVARMLGARMGDALAAAGRPMVFDYHVDPAALEGGGGGAGEPPAAHVRRTAPDMTDSFEATVRNFAATVEHGAGAGPGHWNDPGMLEVGNGGMSSTEYRSHFSLWAQMAAPLIAGNDLTAMSAATRSILTNRDVIAVDQDPLGEQGSPVSAAGGRWVLTKALAGGDRSVVLFNQTDAPAVIATTAAAVGLGPAPAYTLRDLWARNTVVSEGPISADVPPHGVVMYRAAPHG